MKYIFYAALFLIFFGCKKDSNELPGATHSGANTFGCKVNGQTFSTSGNPDESWDKVGVEYRRYTTIPRTWINAKQLSPRWNITMQINFSGDPGDFRMDNEYPYQGKFYDLSGNSTGISGGNEYTTDSTHIGSIHITFFDGNIIAGTFSFDAVNDSGNVIHVTDGRFDIKTN